MRKHFFTLIRNIILRTSYQIGNVMGVNSQGVSIFCYHGFSPRKQNRFTIDPVVFGQHMAKIQKYAQFISIEQMLAVLDGKKVDKKAVVLTIDDGYIDVLKIAPVVARRKVKPVLFVLSDPMRADRKELDYHERLLTIPQLKKLHRAGWVIGCHSATHRDFNRLSKREMYREIAGAKKTLEKNLGFAIDYFAYPKGIYNRKIIEAVKKAGFKAAFSATAGEVTTNSNKWILARTVIDNSIYSSDIPVVHSRSTFMLQNFIVQLGFWPKISGFTGGNL